MIKYQKLNEADAVDAASVNGQILPREGQIKSLQQELTKLYEQRKTMLEGFRVSYSVEMNVDIDVTADGQLLLSDQSL